MGGAATSSVPPVEVDLIGRTVELGELHRVVMAGPGAVLIGPAGVGKSRLAGEAADRSGLDVRRIVVTAAAATVPLGPLAPLLAALGALREVASVPQIYAHVWDLPRTEDPAASSLLYLDDAHLLDDASAGLVHQLVVAGRIRVLATVRVGEPCPDAIRALWKDAGAARIDLAPLARSATTELAQTLLAGPLERRAEAVLWRLSGGNPLELRELVLSLVEDGRLALVEDGWGLVGEVHVSPRLIDLVRERMRHLSDGARRAAQELAIAEPLAPGVASTLLGMEELEELEHRGVVRVVGHGMERSLVELAHPLYGEVFRATIPAARRPTIARRLVEAHDRWPEAVVDPLRYAIWRLDAGVATCDELAQAAQLAYTRAAYPLAVRFGEAALTMERRFDVVCAVGSAYAAQGDAALAEERLREAEALAPDAEARVSALIARAHAWFFSAGRPQDALRSLEGGLGDATLTGQARDDLAGNLAMLRMALGDLVGAAAAAAPLIVRGEASPRTRLVALIASSLTDLAALRHTSARQQVEAAWPLLEDTRFVVPTAEDLLHANLVAIDIFAGNLVAARQRIDDRLQVSSQMRSDELTGFWMLLLSQVLLHEGEPLRSYDVALGSIRLLERSDTSGSLPLAQVEAALAASVSGRTDIALRQLQDIPPEVVGHPRVRARYDLARAAAGIGEYGLQHAAEQAVVAGDRAAGDGILMWAIEAWHLAVRVGLPDTATVRLDEAARAAPDTIAVMLADHARALVAGDVDALIEVARRFAARGFRLLGAEAAAQATAVLRRAGEGRQVRQVAALAREILPRDAGAVTPAFAELIEGPPLTPREREIAFLAARGLTSREIADRLSLSPRTVDNRLATVYDKLGIAGRRELGLVLGQPPDTAVSGR